jgi:hypothetical protein
MDFYLISVMDEMTRESGDERRGREALWSGAAAGEVADSQTRRVRALAWMVVLVQRQPHRSSRRSIPSRSWLGVGGPGQPTLAREGETGNGSWIHLFWESSTVRPLTR